MTRDEKRRRKRHSEFIFERALSIVREEQAAKVFDPDTCALCESDDDIRPVYERHGFGRTRTRWFGPRPMCRDCRRKKGGHWKKAPGFDRPPVLPDPDLAPIQLESTTDF